jgi:hypothetical protein
LWRGIYCQPALRAIIQLGYVDLEGVRLLNFPKSVFAQMFGIFGRAKQPRLTELTTRALGAIAKLATVSLLIGTLICVGVGSASAQTGTTQDLYDRCARTELACGAYLLGMAMTLGYIGIAYQDPQLEYEIIAPLQIFAICLNGAPVNGTMLRACTHKCRGALSAFWGNSGHRALTQCPKESRHDCTV